MTHVVGLRVPFADTDASGRIHWSAVLRWVEAAEHDLLGRHGVTDVSPFPRRTAQVSYLRGLGARDDVEVRLDVVAQGRSSVTYRWLVTHDGTVCVEGEHTVVHVDGSGRPSTLPVTLLAPSSSTRRCSAAPGVKP